MRAMILAAGLGTRLRPLSDELPKPLLPVGDRPAVAHMAAALAASGLTEAVLNTHHLAAAFAGLVDLPLTLRLLHEPDILGTAGAVANAAPLLGDGDVLVWNGDILVDVDLRALAEAHRASASSATLVVAPSRAGEGNLGLGADGRVVRLRGQRFGDEVTSADFVPIHILGPTLRARLPIPGCLAADAYLPALREGHRLATFAVPGPWDDIGTVAAYLAANARWLSSRGLASYVAPGAHVDPTVDITGTIVGAGATLRGTGPVTHSVLWPGATAEAPLDRAVVTTRGTLARA